MKHAPLVSIVLCCHNRKDYLAETLESVLAQEHEPVEIIVMDDGSEDGTDLLMRDYADRVRYYRQECQGIAVARSNASRLANGEYIAYQDDDDLMPVARITRLLAALEQFPQAAFATGDFALIDKDSNLTGARWLEGPLDLKEAPVLLADGHQAVLWPSIPAVPHTTLFRRELGERVGWFDHDFRYACSDSDFLARLGELGPVAYVREVVSLYRRGHAAIWSDDLRSNCSRVQLWEKHLERLGRRNPELTQRLQARLCEALVTITRALQHRTAPNTGQDYGAQDVLQRGLRVLPAKQRLRYAYRTRVRLPLRDLIKGPPITANGQ